MKNFIIGCIRLYRRWISPVIPGTCRFYPTCSAYAVEAVERRGVIEGLALTFRRLLKCHPWNPGGYDPVPDGEKFLKPKFHIPSSK